MRHRTRTPQSAQNNSKTRHLCLLLVLAFSRRVQSGAIRKNYVLFLDKRYSAYQYMYVFLVVCLWHYASLAVASMSPVVHAVVPRHGDLPAASVCDALPVAPLRTILSASVAKSITRD